MKFFTLTGQTGLLHKVYLKTAKRDWQVKLTVDFRHRFKTSQVHRFESDDAALQRAGGARGHRDVLDCVISSSCFPQPPSPPPARPAPAPHSLHPAPHNETNTKGQEVPPVDWGPIKAAIIPVSDFFTGNGFSENMPAVQAEQRIIVMQVASVFLPPPFTPCQPPSLFFFHPLFFLPPFSRCSRR